MEPTDVITSAPVPPDPTAELSALVTRAEQVLAKLEAGAAVEEFGAIGVHHTAVDKTSSWDAGANLKRMGDSPSKAALRDMHAWVDDDKDATTKSAYKLPHHNVDEKGVVGSANMKAVESAMGRLNGGGLDIPAEDRAGVHAHLSAHYKDAGMEAPELKNAAEAEDPIVNFLALVTGSKSKALAAKSQITAALMNPEAQATILDALRRDAGGAQFFGIPNRTKLGMDEDECATCNGTGEVDGKPCPDCDGTGEAPDAQFVASSANDKNGTIDCVWYGGATVPRLDQETGDPYMLNLDMDGCRMGRLNAGAPIFDNHFTGDDFKSILSNLVSGKVGTKAQVGVVQKAWADGPKGMATLQFDLGTPEGTELYRKAKTGIVRNLSFGAWIYNKEKQNPQAQPTSKVMAQREGPGDEGQSGISCFTATDWEPFEISPVTVPADFTTQFLSAQPHLARAKQVDMGTSPIKETPVEQTTQVTGDARLEQERLDAVRAETVALERKRVSDIRAMGATHKLENLATKLIDSEVTAEQARAKFTAAQEILHRASKFEGQLGKEWIAAFVDSGKSAEEFATVALERIAEKGQQNLSGKTHTTHEQVSITHDSREKFREVLEAGILMRHNRQFYSDWAKVADPSNPRAPFLLADKAKYEALCEEQRKFSQMGRQFAGVSLMDAARECLSAAGINFRGMSRDEIVRIAMQGRVNRLVSNSGYTESYFDGGAGESTSDFPSILANVANKTLRQGYEAAPRTFQAFAKQVTAQDFKPVNRVQLSDSPVLAPMNENGEYTRAVMKDSNQGYSLGEFGKIVAVTRKVIINDDLQALTRVPAALGVAAARLESDKVWAVLTGNQVMGEDNVALFNSAHGNYFTGGNSALALGATNPPTGMTYARAKMRQQTGPQGTFLNLVPRFAAVPTVLETVLLQMIAPLNIASSDSTKVVPEWVRSIVPVVEPRLDAVSTTGWYLIADPADIDTIEYCYLEGQQGVFIETRQPFESDGLEIKARMDFAAAAIDFRGLQSNAGV